MLIQLVLYPLHPKSACMQGKIEVVATLIREAEGDGIGAHGHWGERDMRARSGPREELAGEKRHKAIGLIQTWARLPYHHM